MTISHEELIILGRLIGTYVSWDELEAGAYQYDGFTPAEGVNIPVCSVLNVDFNKGTLEVWKMPGEVLNDFVPENLILRKDLVATVKDLPVVPHEQGELFEASPLNQNKPHKGYIANWHKQFYSDKREDFFVIGIVLSAKDGEGRDIEGDCRISTSEVVAEHITGDRHEIETQNNRYTLVGPAESMSK